jgi:hypothetical protein
MNERVIREAPSTCTCALSHNHLILKRASYAAGPPPKPGESVDAGRNDFETFAPSVLSARS